MEEVAVNPSSAGRTKRSSPYSRWILLVTILQAVIVVTLESVFAYVVFSRSSEKDNRDIRVYVVIFLLSQAFQVLLMWDAVRNENTMQVFGCLFPNFGAMAYGLFQMGKKPDNVSFDSSMETILAAVVVVIAVSQCVLIWLSYQLYREFGWRIYKNIGADVTMRNMYRSYQILLLFLKLDVFFFVAFSLQFLVLVLEDDNYEFVLTLVALPLSVLLLYVAVVALRREDRRLFQGFIFGSFLGLAYFLFKLVRMHTDFGTEGDPNDPDKYLISRNFLTFFAVLAIMMLTLTLIGSFICMRNFGRGLKQYLHGSKRVEQRPGARNMTLADD